MPSVTVPAVIPARLADQGVSAWADDTAWSGENWMAPFDTGMLFSMCVPAIAL